MATSSSFSTSNQYIKYRIVVTENSYSIENNTSSVNVKVDAWRTNSGYTTSGSGTCYCTINGTKYSQSISNSQKITQNSHTVLFNRTVTVAHNADGSKSLGVSAYIKHDRFDSSSQGFNVKLTTIPRQANIVSAPDFYDTDNPTITYNNPAGDIAAITSLQACISLTGDAADVPYRDISKTGTSYTFNLTQAERNTLLSACPNSNTLSVKFIVRTILSGQTYYSVVNKTMTVKNANPTITGASYEDTNATTTTITQNNQQIIQGQSTVSFEFSTLAALKYATLNKIEVTVNSVTVSSNLSGSTVIDKTVAFGNINSSSDLTATIKLTDSRGNVTTQNLNITILAWSLPTAIISCTRRNNFYDETTINVDALYSSLDNKNTITIQYQYKQVTSSSWSALQTLQDNVPVTVTLDNHYQWNVKIIVTDRIGSTTYNLTVDRGIPIIYFDRLRRSVSVNKFPDHNNSFESDGDIYVGNHIVNGDITFTKSGTNTRQIKGQVGDTDYFRLAGGATGSDAGFAELATSGDGNEPIYVKQYTGEFANEVNKLDLLDANGDTNIPNDLTVGGDITANGVKLPHYYSETVQKVGTWIDGTTDVYEKVIVLPSTVSLSSDTWVDVVAWTDNSQILNVTCLLSTYGNCWNCINAYVDNGKLRLQNIRSSTLTADIIIVKYFNIPTP